MKPKETHLIISLTITFALLIFLFIFTFVSKTYITNNGIANALLTTAGIFIGFIISALGVFYAIPLREEVKIALQKQGYLKQIARNFIISIFCFFACVIICIALLCFTFSITLNNVFNIILISAFIFGILLTILTCVNFFKIVTKR